MPGAYVNISGYKETAAYLATIADELKPVTTQILAEEGVRVMQDAEPPQRDVTRATAYGDAGAGGDWTTKSGGTMAPVPGFFSARQYRYVMWGLSSGTLDDPYQRTGATREAWQVVGEGTSAKPSNNSEGAKFTNSPTYQSNHEKLVGWLTTTSAIRAKMDYILQTTQKRLFEFIELTMKGKGPL